MRKNKKHLLIRGYLLEQILILSGEISIMLDISKSMLEADLFTDKNNATTVFNESITEFISTLLRIELNNVAHIKYLSAILDETLGDQIKLRELNVISKRVDSSRNKLYALSQNLADTFQDIRTKQGGRIC